MENNERNSYKVTDLMIACKTGNIAAVHEILEWRDVKGKRVDINARDENGQTALSFAKQSNNAKIVAMIEHNLFLRAVENGDTNTVKTYLTEIESNFEVLYCREETDILPDHHGHNSVQLKMPSDEDDLIEYPPPKRFEVGIETEFVSKDAITRSVWLKAVAIAQHKYYDEMSNVLFNDRRFISGFDEDGQTILHQIVAEYFANEYYDSRKLETIEILLKSRKFSANISNLQNETIFEYVCKIKPKECRKLYDLLRIFHQNEIDLNGKNRNGETFLMLACKYRRFDIVRSLIKLASRGFILDIDAIDNSGETALMKAKENNDSKIVAALLGKKFISAADDENEDSILKDDHFLHGFIEEELTTFNVVVAEYLQDNMGCGRMKTIDILLKSWKYNANVLNLQNETIYEIICKVNPEYYRKTIDDLLQILLRNEIDLNGRNKNGETFLMLACKNKRIELVRSLLDLVAHGSVLDIDVVDNSGETALMKAKHKGCYEIVLALLKFKFISAVKDENANIVKAMLAEYLYTSDIFVKSWNSNQDHADMSVERETKSDIWLEAMNIAMETGTKLSQEILKLLLDCDVLFNQEIEMNNSFFYKLTHGSEINGDKKLRLIELLLKYGKINPNDRDEGGRTALYLAEEEGLISLLIRYGADVNRKDNEGKTPLMHFLDNRGGESVPVLRTIFEEAETLVNLDAMDCNGQTALMHAVMWHRSHTVEFLLNKGSSVNLSDHLGFTALHYALHKNINEHFNFPRNSEELKKIKEIAILYGTEKHEHFWRIDKWSEERRKIFEMLMQRPDIDVNLLSIEKFSPLDIAEGQIPDLPSSIKDALKEKGAVLNVFRQTESQSTSDFHLDFTYMLTLPLKQSGKAVHKPLASKRIYLFRERFLALIETLNEQKVSDKDQQGRTALHLVAISSYDFLDLDLANKIVDKLISLGCNVNEPDIYGRTPLHYANEMLWELLISKGADASIKDMNGDIAIKKTLPFNYETSDIVRKVKDRIGEEYLLRLMNNKQMEINVWRVDDSKGERVPKVNLAAVPRLLWKKGEYAFRHPLVEKITKEVADVMKAIATEIESLDPRFEIRPELVGSSNEGTKINEPDEFDFCFVLTQFGELCEVSLSPELPIGFVRLKRKPIKAGETSDFDSFFEMRGILNTERLKWHFTTILRNAMVNINSQLSFKWSLKLEDKSDRFSDYIKK